METFYGVWSPTLGVLPTVDNYDFAAFYIIDTGVLDGTTYTKDKWLIYICEARGKLDQRSYWRITDGVVVFNFLKCRITFSSFRKNINSIFKIFEFF